MKDIHVQVPEGDKANTVKTKAAFESGTINQYGQVDYTGDDMLIWYHDLTGKPVMYQHPKKQKMEKLWRVRWQNPDLHTDKKGRPMKYKSPYGSGSHIYIPERIRDLYRHKRAFDTLFVQEGEKKAEKACKHGIYSVGIMGIHNIAGKGQLPDDFLHIIKTCEVKNVVFLLDSDWDEISNNIKSGDNIDYRARTFKSAVINFRDYFKTYYNLGINIEIYFGHINKNEKNDKGIDDLLANTLKKNETALKEDIVDLINTKEKEGEFVKLHRITSFTDYQFNELWDLNSAKAFAQKHKDILKNIPEFKFGRHKWRFNEDEEFESAQPITDEEKYWDKEEWETAQGRIKSTLTFNYVKAYRFLANRGFGRLMMASGNFVLAKREHQLIKVVEPYQVRDYITEFTEQIANEDVQNMLYRGGPQYLGPEKLSNLKFIDPSFEKSSREHQYLYFKNKAIKITASGTEEIELTKIENCIWADKIINFEIKELEEPLLNVFKLDENWINENIKEAERKEFKESHLNKLFYKFSSTGKKCHFLKFLDNTSNFTWKKKANDITLEEELENAHHFIAKLSAIGYLLHNYKDKSNAKGVIGVDGKMSEIGASEGRSGKSLLGNAIAEFVPQEYIGAKNKKITEDQFLFSEVNEKTDNIFLDDARANIDYEFFFPIITGQMKINVKGGGRFSLKPDQTPKLYMTTNHSIMGHGSSYRDRQWFIAFSDYYNDKHKPIDDFKVPFFDEWDGDQYNLFYHMGALAIQIYLKYGVIESPQDKIEKRRLRQQMGEDFLAWATEFYADNSGNLGDKMPRKELADKFYEDYSHQRKYITAVHFKRRLKFFCEYEGLIFNPHMLNSDGTPKSFNKKDGSAILDDKSGGVEYITIDTKFKPV